MRAGLKFAVVKGRYGRYRIIKLERSVLIPGEKPMSVKLLACLLAAVLVTAGGAYYYHGGSHGCGGCPLGLTGSPAPACDSDSSCPTQLPPCCLSALPAPSSAPACCEAACCDAKADAFAAGFGGAAFAAKGLK
jgi:hypothetical protein